MSVTAFRHWCINPTKLVIGMKLMQRNTRQFKPVAWLANSLCLMLLVSTTSSHAEPLSAGELEPITGHSPRTFFFAQPESGVRVDQYEIKLSFPDRQSRRYLVPDDCGILLNEANFGARRPDNILGKNLWFKAINDCRYVMMMPAELRAVEIDHVSDYDFHNARLVDLPFASQCRASDEKDFIQQCRNEQPDKLSLRAFFPFLEVEPQAASDQLTEECRFHAGAFRGRLILTAEGIRCQKDSRAHGLRLLSVDYGDLNADGVQDAVLRIVPLGRGVSRMPIMLPLTRKAANVPFSIPTGLPMDPLQGKP